MSEKVDVHFTYDTDYIMLAYRRSPRLRGDEHVHHGYFDVQAEGASEMSEFVELTYLDMFRSLSELANRFPLARLVLRRLEQGPDSTALALGEDSCELIRKDPDEYVKKTTIPPQRIVLKLGADARVTEAVDVGTIRSGHDTLADAFGEYVYAKLRRGGSTECPACGRWKALTSVESNGYGNTRCYGDEGCGFFAPCKCIPLQWGGWAVFKVEVLLDIDVMERFFLPRKWNDSGPWISREALKAKYEKYLEEKESCRRTSSDDRPAS